MADVHTFWKPPGILGSTARGMVFSIDDVEVALTLYWLKPLRDASNNIIGGNTYVGRLATEVRQIWFGRINVNDPVVIKNVFSIDPEKTDLVIWAIAPDGVAFDPETLDNGGAHISIIAGRF